MSQVFKVWISECPSFLVKHYGNPILVIGTLWAAVSGYPAEDTISASLKKQKGEKARAIICLILVPQLKSYVIQITTAKEALDALERTFKD
jgi:hypothetical protein